MRSPSTETTDQEEKWVKHCILLTPKLWRQSRVRASKRDLKWVDSGVEETPAIPEDQEKQKYFQKDEVSN